jgi:hypothetical protein
VGARVRVYNYYVGHRPERPRPFTFSDTLLPLGEVEEYFPEILTRWFLDPTHQPLQPLVLRRRLGLAGKPGPLPRAAGPGGPPGAGLAATVAVLAATTAVLLVRRRWRVGLAAWAAYALVRCRSAGSRHSGSQLVAERYGYLPGVALALLRGRIAAVVVRAWWAAPRRRAAAATLLLDRDPDEGRDAPQRPVVFGQDADHHRARRATPSDIAKSTLRRIVDVRS